MTFDIKRHITENNDGTLNEARAGSFTALKADLANSLLTEQRHYKAFIKASKLSTQQTRTHLRQMQAAMKESQQIAARLYDALDSVLKGD